MKTELINLFLLQFLAHLLSDFYFQWNKMVDDKIIKNIKSKYLYLHIFITFFFSWLLSFQFNFYWISILIAVTHLITDILKSYLERKKLIIKYLFFIDQFIHLFIIVISIFIFNKYDNINLPGFINNTKIIAIITGIIFILAPVNYFIKAIFTFFEISIPDKNDLKNAGKLIGNIERILVLIFIFIGEYEAIGFLLTAKSILRYNENDNNFPNKTEYVLAGTLLSFTFAILTGLMIIKII